MKTTEEKIVVMQAFVDGKQIEFYHGGEWKTTTNPKWDWMMYDYRIKPESKYRPFENAAELMAAIKEHGDWVKLIINDWRVRLIGYSNKRVDFAENKNIPFDEAFDNFVFADGTPFGKWEE